MILIRRFIEKFLAHPAWTGVGVVVAIFGITISLNSKPTESVAKQPSTRQDQNLESTSSLAPEMVTIPGGQFIMGTDNKGAYFSADTTPLRRVEIDDFLIAKYPVTVQEFYEYLKLTGYKIKEFDPAYDFSTGPNRDSSCEYYQGSPEPRNPMTCVTWIDAKGYILWLSEVTGTEFRLPSESEWEYTAKKGYIKDVDLEASDTDLSAFNCVIGNSFDCRSDKGIFMRVDAFPPNEFGVYDMYGNATEWVEDCFHENYVGAPNDHSPWTLDNGVCDLSQSPNGTHKRMARGGTLHPSVRQATSVTHRTLANGFRVAQSIKH